MVLTAYFFKGKNKNNNISLYFICIEHTATIDMYNRTQRTTFGSQALAQLNMTYGTRTCTSVTASIAVTDNRSAQFINNLP